MNNHKILEMLSTGRYEELEKAISDEIYADSLKTKPGAKKRYSAMKKYFSYHKSNREILTKPCAGIEFEDETYISFCNSWSLALTKEDCGEIELYDISNGTYPDVTRLIRFDGIKKKIDFGKVFAEARSKGYRLTRNEVEHDFKYLMLYDDAYYKIGLLEATFGIIDNGEAAMTYHPEGNSPLTIKNSLGLCMVMPVRFNNEDGKADEDKIIIEVKCGADDL